MVLCVQMCVCVCLCKRDRDEKSQGRRFFIRQSMKEVEEDVEEAKGRSLQSQDYQQGSSTSNHPHAVHSTDTYTVHTYTHCTEGHEEELRSIMCVHMRQGKQVKCSTLSLLFERVIYLNELLHVLMLI